MKIGEVATSAGVSVRALRYYEEQGLLHAERTRGGQRVYDVSAVARVRLLQQLYSAGLTSSTIIELLPCVDSPSEHATAASVAVMREEYARLSAQIDDLITVRAQLGEILGAASAHLPHEATRADPDHAAHCASWRGHPERSDTVAATLSG